MAFYFHIKKQGYVVYILSPSYAMWEGNHEVNRIFVRLNIDEWMRKSNVNTNLKLLPNNPLFALNVKKNINFRNNIIKIEEDDNLNTELILYK